MIKWFELLAEVLVGLTIVLPLVLKLVEAVRDNVKEKNWDKILAETLKLMTEAEKQFTEGAAKKAWVMAGVRTIAASLEYNYDAVAEQKVSDMIDAMIEASKILNKK